MIRTRLVSLLLGLSLMLGVAVAVPSMARAGEGDSVEDPATAEAKRHYYRGEKLFALGRFREALAAYESAFEAAPLPEFLFNIGQCHRNLGNYRSAVFSFRKYLRLVPAADNRIAVKKLIGELEAEIEAADRDKGNGPLPPPPPPPSHRSPIYTRWWFWTGIAAVGAGTAALVLTLRSDGLPASDLGNLDFHE